MHILFVLIVSVLKKITNEGSNYSLKDFIYKQTIFSSFTLSRLGRETDDAVFTDSTTLRSPPLCANEGRRYLTSQHFFRRGVDGERQEGKRLLRALRERPVQVLGLGRDSPPRFLVNAHRHGESTVVSGEHKPFHRRSGLSDPRGSRRSRELIKSPSRFRCWLGYVFDLRVV